MQRWVIGGVVCLVIAASAHGQEPPFSPEQTAQLMRVPEGFHVALFAGEPDVVKPIAMTLDDRGRLWVVESHSYPNWIKDGKPGHDRILIFEDTQGAGHFDKRTVFLDNGTNLSGIALGFGGVYLCATPNFLFIPIKPGEDKPTGPPEILLDGWSLEAKHNVFNTLVWGPDGWLYGCNGILATSKIGKPGTPDEKRVPFNCGVWRFHPTRKVCEVFAWGTTNPWGLDFDARGEMFITNCVIKHLFHVVQGGHYERMYGQDLNPHVYGLMQSCADHFHWAGGDWTTSRGGQGAHSDAGGGHAHTGCMIYQGDNWPDEYRGKVFMGNLHGNRINMDILERKGSGYVAHHGKDFLTCSDPWFRPLAIINGPDGVYLSDWHDTGECHNYDQVRPCGRIYKITYGKPKKIDVDLAKLSDVELVKLQLHKNEWYARQARRLLQERTHAGTLDAKVRPTCFKTIDGPSDTQQKLRVLWALHGIAALDQKTLVNLLDHQQEDLRGWAVRLVMHNGRISDKLAEKLSSMARNDPSASVRLALASSLQPVASAELGWSFLWDLSRHAEDLHDANLPPMIWYGAETRITRMLRNPNEGSLDWLLDGGFKMRQLDRNLVRRLVESNRYLERLYSCIKTNFEDPSGLRGEKEHPEWICDQLRGMYEGFRGRRGLKAPDEWRDFLRMRSQSENSEVKECAMALAVLYGDTEAVKSLMQVASDSKLPRSKREAALQTLLEAKAPGMSTMLEELLSDQLMRSATIRALAAMGDEQTPQILLERYRAFSQSEKSDAIATLTSRPSYAMALLNAMESGKIPRRDLSAFAARKLLTFKDPALTAKLTKVWGTLRPAQAKSALMARYFGITAPEALKKADRSHGRLIFSQTCAKCHTLFGEGGKIGPDLTGSQRANNEYLLTKLLDPSATVAKDYQMTIIATKNGRTLNGIVKEENDKIVTLQTENELVRIAKSEIEAREQSNQSMMPEGQLEKMTESEVRDLFAYLAGAEQAPLPRGEIRK